MAIAALVAVAVGFGAGWILRGRAHPRPPGQASYAQRREGSWHFVNPLLECELADDVLRNEELRPFKDKVERYLRSRMAGPDAPRAASVYFRELNDGIWFAIRGEENYVPASLRKVPFLIAILKAAEGAAGPALLDRELVHDLAHDQSADQNVQPAVKLVPGARYTVRELLRRMIVYSDNNSFALLGRVVDPAELDRIYALLPATGPVGPDGERYLSVQTYASFFRILFNATYLTKADSEWALSLLAKAEFRAGLADGVPEGVTVAHKFGEKSDARTLEFQLHDCGIVYRPDNPYLLCVMTRGPHLSQLASVISGISRFVWGEVEDQLHAAAR